MSTEPSDRYEPTAAPLVPLPRGITTEELAQEVDRVRFGIANDRASRHEHNRRIMSALDEVRNHVMEQDGTLRGMVGDLTRRMDRMEMALVGGSGAKGLNDQLNDLKGAVGEVARAIGDMRSEMLRYQADSERSTRAVQTQVDGILADHIKEREQARAVAQTPTAWAKVADSAIAWAVPVCLVVSLLIAIKVNVLGLIAKAAGVGP
jgi:uncharacterized protein YukE